ncbi:RING finger protein 141-like [Sitodiplosis mosellana]|uniref:RING finger protein 141-like n=1 Tax=Sitodiplosis mosellana TaxID=263140 RepID=UPI002444424A|nr:RING finger protein 141-like [Sitodiplosis mosellana]
MGQTIGTPSTTESIEDTVDTIRYGIRKHAQCLKEISSLTYEEFNSCLSNLNDLSRKCLDSNGKVTIFAVKKGSDQSFLWKATVRIACVKCDPESNRIENYKLINLREFLKVFNTFQTHLEAMSSCEEQHERARRLPNLLDNVAEVSPDEESAFECCICLDRKTDLILPCEHVFCSTCIEKWNENHDKCPLCQTKLNGINDSWVLSELPKTNEVNEEILTELNAITNDSSNEADVHQDEDDDSDD